MKRQLRRLARGIAIKMIRFGDRTAHAKHALGLVDLATLLAPPRGRFDAIDLMHAATVAPPLRTGAGPVLDEVARAQFRARLDALEALLHELKAATGLNGRRRALGDDGERARKGVTGRIRDSIARLRALGDHLATAVETGVTCVYAPTRPVHWRT